MLIHRMADPPHQLEDLWEIIPAQRMKTPRADLDDMINQFETEWEEWLYE